MVGLPGVAGHKHRAGMANQQLALLAVLLITSKGGAGVAGSAIAVLAATLASTNAIPVASIALILGIHRLLSGAFVFVNIIGNAVATVVVAGWENALDRSIMMTELNRGYVALDTGISAGDTVLRPSSAGVMDARIP